jgi:integrase/recombinase XerD
VTQLRQKMLEELQRRNYSHRTAKIYVRIVREFATYFHQPPDKLGPEQSGSIRPICSRARS